MHDAVRQPVFGNKAHCRERCAFIRRVECRAAGLWSARAARLVLQWADHVRGERWPASRWPARTVGWHVVEWCAIRRRIPGSAALGAGRIHTRGERGHVVLRWHDSVAKALTICQDPVRPRVAPFLFISIISILKRVRLPRPTRMSPPANNHNDNRHTNSDDINSTKASKHHTHHAHHTPHTHHTKHTQHTQRTHHTHHKS